MKFKYIAQEKDGEIKKGIIRKKSLKEAKSELLAQGLDLISLDEFKKEKKGKSFLFWRISRSDKILFVKHLEVMIKAGIPLREALLEIKEQTSSKKFKKILGNIINDVENGKPLGYSLSKYPSIFDTFFINLIKTGERSGTLEESLKYLALQLEKSYALFKKIRGAMIYPALILISTLGLMIVLAIFVLPNLIPVFRSFYIDLPLTTRILVKMIEGGKDYGIFALLSGISIVALFVFISRFKRTKIITSKLVLKTPLLSKISRFINLARFSRTLHALIKGGVPIVEALDISADTLNNYVYKKELRNLSLSVQKGEKMGNYLAGKSKMFPSVFCRMISVGEKTGKLDESLLYLAEFYEKEVDDLTKNISTIIEPLLLIIIGLLVAFIAISIIMPIYELTHGLSGLRK